MQHLKCCNVPCQHAGNPWLTGPPPAVQSVQFRRAMVTATRASANSAASTSAAAAAMGPVLVRDGELVPAPATAQLLLSQHRGWSYTTALLRQQYEVIDWELHVRRLIRNMQVLGQKRPPAYAAFLAWQDQQASPDAAAAALQQLLNPMVASALHHQAMCSADVESSQVMLVVALGDRDTPPGPSPVPAASAATQPAAVPLPLAGPPPLSVLVWAKAVAPTAPVAAKVLVAGDPRPAAQAKHCDWVVARQPLEQLKQQAGADEVVLCDSSGALLEGLASNFYVIADAAELAAHGQQVETVPAGPQSHTAAQAATPHQQLCSDELSSEAEAQTVQQRLQKQSETSGLVLLTTGPGSDALWGVTQQRVLQACQQLQLPVVLQPAQTSSTRAWREAFLTNCIKGLQEVQEVQSADGRIWAASQPATVLSLLQTEVQKLQRVTDMRGWQ